MKIGDKILILLLIPFLVFSIFLSRFDTNNNKALIINNNGIEKKYSLNQKQIVEIEGKLGKVKIEIENNRARFIESNCKDKLCIKKGWISSVGEYSACLPNGIFIIIIGEREIDGISE